MKMSVNYLQTTLLQKQTGTESAVKLPRTTGVTECNDEELRLKTDRK